MYFISSVPVAAYRCSSSRGHRVLGVRGVLVVGNAGELYEFQRANAVAIIETPGDRPYGLRDPGSAISTATSWGSATMCSTPDRQ